MKQTDTFSMNGYRICIPPSGIGYFYATDDPGEVPALVFDHYCSICARTRNGQSRDGENNCAHKSLLRFAVKVLDGGDDEGYYRELRDTYRAEIGILRGG